jgi:hypothetical protein
MLDWQLRVIEEAKELKIKIDKLKPFVESEFFGTLKKDEMYYLERQLEGMILYSNAIESRTKTF